MYDPGENEEVELTEEQAEPLAEQETPVEEPEISAPEEPETFESTDRVNGEYHYKNGYTQEIYADAHYVPEDESTAPPRYYTPPERASRETASPRKRRKKRGVFVRTLCLCLVCALLGGLGGVAILGRGLNGRLDALEQRLEEQSSPLVIGGENSIPVSAAPIADSSGAVSATQIYDLACQQVVGITTEVTYTNFFGMTSSSAVSGSGFVISADGYILTNYHVIEYAAQYGYTITVMLYDGTQYEASIIGTEQSNDIAVLKIDATGLTPVAFGDSEAIRVGDRVYAVGNPLGELEFSMSTGWVSALDRVITTEESVSINMFQIDAAVNPGNSGGPVYNDRGEVIGIVTAKYSDTGVEGLGFAIPINDAVKIANDLITKGYVTGKAYMGLRVDQQYSSLYAQYYNMPLGAYVRSVESGSAAEKAGLQAGDIITRLGDETVESYSDLTQALKRFSAGDTTELELYRAGESLTVSITFDEYRPNNT